jgi:transposase
VFIDETWAKTNMTRTHPRARRRCRHGQLGSHKGCAVCAAIRAAKAKLLFLPAYSPDLNPIEQAFTKMKTLLRKADARTIDETWRTIGAARLLHPNRMRKLLHQRWICFCLRRSCSSQRGS